MLYKSLLLEILIDACDRFFSSSVPSDFNYEDCYCSGLCLSYANTKFLLHRTECRNKFRVCITALSSFYNVLGSIYMEQCTCDFCEMMVFIDAIVVY